MRGNPDCRSEASDAFFVIKSSDDTGRLVKIRKFPDKVICVSA